MGYTWKEVPHAPPGEGYWDGEPEWLDENRIQPTSQPWVQISFFIDGVGGSGHRLNSNNSVHEVIIDKFLFQNANNQNILILPRGYIESIEFDGPCIGARRGTLSIIDPEGIWATCIEHIGFWQSNNAGRMNMVIQYGWVGLRPNGQEDQFVESIPSLLYQTKFSLGENGELKIDVEFVENAEKILNSVKFNRLDDMILLNSQLNQDLKEKTIAEILRFMVAEDSSPGIYEQLQNYGIILEFDDTFEEGDQMYGAGDGSKDIKIRIGDSLGSKINELIAKTIPQDIDSDVYNYSYEMIRKPYVETTSLKQSQQIGTLIGANIRFGWRRALKETTGGSDANLTIQDQAAAFESGKEKPERGPSLLWKQQSTSIDDKTLIKFDIDLKAFNFATSMMRSELDRKLSAFSEDDWSDIEETIKLMSEDPENAARLAQTPSQLASTAQSGATDAHANTALEYDRSTGGLFGWGWFGAKSEKDERIMGIVEEFNEAIRNSSNNIENQIQAIIANNVFKANATIMGDPAISTRYPFLRIYFTCDFTAMGEFASFFNERTWLLMKARHKIDETGYVTEMELLSAPPSRN